MLVIHLSTWLHLSLRDARGKQYAGVFQFVDATGDLFELCLYMEAHGKYVPWMSSALLISM